MKIIPIHWRVVTLDSSEPLLRGEICWFFRSSEIRLVTHQLKHLLFLSLSDIMNRQNSPKFLLSYRHKEDLNDEKSWNSSYIAIKCIYSRWIYRLEFLVYDHILTSKWSWDNRSTHYCPFTKFYWYRIKSVYKWHADILWSLWRPYTLNS